jgi:hypothetical protein
MAIDTATKRRSVGGMTFLPYSAGVTPNATHNMVWRQESGWGYMGIVPDTTLPSSTIRRLMMMGIGSWIFWLLLQGI